MTTIERVPHTSRWPWAFLAIFLVVATVGIWLVVANGESVAEQVPYVIAFALFGFVGALILSRGLNAVGALLLWGSSVTAISFLTGEIVTELVRGGVVRGPVVVGMALVSNLGWVTGILPVLLGLPLLFPDGRLPSRRWRPLAWLIVLVLALLTLETVFGQMRLTGSVESIGVANPFFVSSLESLPAFDVFANVSLLACLAASIASLVVRFRRARGVERQQIRWVAASTLLIFISFVLSTVVTALGAGGFVDALITGLAFLSLPVAVGIGVLQYRLYDLDIVVKKALAAGALVVIAIVAYAAVVWILGSVASERTGSATLFVLAIVLGLAFRPVSRQARRLADRIVYGERATPYEVLAEFSQRVGGAFSGEDVLPRMARILGEGMGAGSAIVWLRLGEELVPAAIWPPDAEPPPIPPSDLIEVTHQGEGLGALSVSMPATDPIDPAREKLVRDLAAQAGLVMRNVLLSEDLKARFEDLKAAQKRLVSAQDQERRRLERNIHDGAQQQLVAIRVKLRLAEQMAGRDPDKVPVMLADLQADTESALQDLRDLARGIYPPLLADQGLVAALEAQARKSTVPVSVEADGIERYPQEAEAAIYFCVLEALQNTAKYAQASAATVRLRRANGQLTFTVTDDGRGFDPGRRGYGTGLQGIADRLGALEGQLTVASEPQHGTSITGQVPVGGRP